MDLNLKHGYLDGYFYQMTQHQASLCQSLNKCEGVFAIMLKAGKLGLGVTVFPAVVGLNSSGWLYKSFDFRVIITI